jgi:hypothetical protein
VDGIRPPPDVPFGELVLAQVIAHGGSAGDVAAKYEQLVEEHREIAERIAQRSGKVGVT